MRVEGPNPGGLCQCGCGGQTQIAKRIDTRLGHVKGEPVRYIRGHSRRLPDPNPSGFCMCGCGTETELQSQTQHRRYVYGHQARKPGPDYIIDAVTGCHVWQKSTDPNGYALAFENGKPVRVARRNYEKKYGPIPASLFACHHCDNPPCVNADHVFPGTQKDNMVDAAAKGRMRSHNATKTHCPQGHPYEGGNLYVGKKGNRVCRVCRNERASRRRDVGKVA